MTKYFYMKILGLFLVIAGFSYSMTSFYNFYDYIFGDLVIANANIYIMSLGLVFPLYMFIFGVFFYFYTDKFFAKINPFIFTSGVAMMIVGISRLIVSNGIMQFIHFSFSFVTIVLAGLLIFGCLRFKY